MSNVGKELVNRLKRLNEQIEDYEMQIRHAEDERLEVQNEIDDMNAKYVTIPEGTKAISWFGKDWNGEWVFCCCHAPREIGEWRYDEGTVQQLAFWDRELSDDELWEIEKADGGVPKLEGLIAWYSLAGGDMRDPPMFSETAQSFKDTLKRYYDLDIDTKKKAWSFYDTNLPVMEPSTGEPAWGWGDTKLSEIRFVAGDKAYFELSSSSADFAPRDYDFTVSGWVSPKRNDPPVVSLGEHWFQTDACQFFDVDYCRFFDSEDWVYATTDEYGHDMTTMDGLREHCKITDKLVEVKDKRIAKLEEKIESFKEKANSWKSSFDTLAVQRGCLMNQIDDYKKQLTEACNQRDRESIKLHEAKEEVTCRDRMIVALNEAIDDGRKEIDQLNTMVESLVNSLGECKRDLELCRTDLEMGKKERTLLQKRVDNMSRLLKENGVNE